MIYTKTRRNSQSKQHRSVKQYDYLNQSNNQNLCSNYFAKQRNNIGSITPSQKTRSHTYHNSLNKINKRYDYSINLQNQTDCNQSYNKIDLINITPNTKIGNRPLQNNFFHNNNQLISKQIKEIPENHNKRYSVTKLPSQKVDIKKLLQMNDYSNRNSLQKQNNRRVSYQQNRNLDQKVTKDKEIQQRYAIGRFKNNNYANDPFYFTDKFKQFECAPTALNQLTNKKVQNTIGKAKYQSRYNKMRTKPYQRLLQVQEHERPQKPLFNPSKNKLETQFYAGIKQNKWAVRQKLQTDKKLVQKPYQKAPQSNDKNKSVINYELLQKSQQQNIRIKQKINRISELNKQINTKLQNMLIKRKLA